MEDRVLNEKESVEIITRMIYNTQKKVELGNGNIFLLWGYVTLTVSLVVYTLAKLGFAPACFWLWFAIPVVGIPIMIYHLRKREMLVTTYIDKVITYIWRVIQSLAIIMPFAYLTTSYRLEILFIECLLINIGVTITGLVTNMKPVTIGGVLGLIIAFGFLLPLGLEANILFAVMAIVTLIIPGHIWNHTVKKESKKESDV